MNNGSPLGKLRSVLTRRCLWLVGLFLLFVSGCQQNTTELPRHTLIYGGDVFTARRLNYALLDDSARSEILEELSPVLGEADLAMLNSEGVVTVGGHFYNLGNSTYMYRAHPFLIDELVKAGVDIVTLGNNHMPDYGPEALIEMTDRLKKAGIGYTGAGVDHDDAARPVYRKVGDTIVAIVGIELTYARRYEATEKRAGGHYVREAFLHDRWDRMIIDHLKNVATEARRHAHVVICSPHWDSHETPPTVSEDMRRMGRRMIEIGYDAVLAHGRHEAQGVEVHNGKPIVYDAGNIVVDYNARGNESRGMLWQIEFSKAGVHRLEGIPVAMELNRSEIADGRVRSRLFDRVRELSEPYGTEFRLRNNKLLLELNPGGVRGPGGDTTPPRRETTEEIRVAPTDVLHERLPREASKIDVQFENGISLVGYELLAPQVRSRRLSHQIVVLYWKTSSPLEQNYTVHLEARHVKGGRIQKRRTAQNHLPGDWLLPTPMWPVGKIVQDAQVFRFGFEPEGEVAFFAGLRRHGESWSRRNPDGDFVTPISSSVGLFEKRLIPLGRTPYSSDAPHMKNVYYNWRDERDIELSPEQPWGAPPVKTRSSSVSQDNEESEAVEATESGDS